MNDDDLRELCKHIAKNLPEIKDEALSDELTALKWQIEVIHHNSLMFESIFSFYEANYSLLNLPLEEVSLHVSDASPLVQFLLKWRCERAK